MVPQHNSLQLKLSVFEISSHYNYCFLPSDYRVKKYYWIFETDNKNIKPHSTLVNSGKEYVYTHTHTHTHTHTLTHSNTATMSPCFGSYTETSRALSSGVRRVLTLININSSAVFKQKVSLCILSGIIKGSTWWKFRLLN